MKGSGSSAPQSANLSVSAGIATLCTRFRFPILLVSGFCGFRGFSDNLPAYTLFRNMACFGSIDESCSMATERLQHDTALSYVQQQGDNEPIEEAKASFTAATK